jgi:hypothetical protein
VQTTVLDEQKLLYDTHFSAAGAIPGIGDVISAGYTIWDRYKTLRYELPQEYEEGNLEAVLADIGIVGWGVVQVLAEPVPVIDHVADVIGTALDQWKYSRSQRYAFLRLRGALLSFDYRAFAKYLVFRGFSGLPVNEQGLYELKRGAALGGKALESFALLSDTPGRAGARASFEVGVEIRILASESEALFEAARTLKVPVRAIAASAPSFKPDWAALVPIRLAAAVRDVLITGPQVALDPQLGEGVSWRFGCARGSETVRLQLADGTKTEPVVFENRVFNQLNGIRVRTREGRALESISLREGETLEGLEVVGVVRSGQIESPGPLLTGTPCCQVSLGDPSIAELQVLGRWPDAKLKLSARSAGASRLTVIVGVRLRAGGGERHGDGAAAARGRVADERDGGPQQQAQSRPERARALPRRAPGALRQRRGRRAEVARPRKVRDQRRGRTDQGRGALVQPADPRPSDMELRSGSGARRLRGNLQRGEQHRLGRAGAVRPRHLQEVTARRVANQFIAPGRPELFSRRW